MVLLINRFSVIVMTILLVSCYSKNFDEPGFRDTPTYRTSRTYKKPYDKVWEAVVSTMREAPITKASKASGEIVTDWIFSQSDRVYSGYDDTKIPYKVRYRLFIDLAGDSNSTNVNITNEEEYMVDSISSGGDFDGAVYKWKSISTSTLKEKRLLDALDRALGDRS